jgi:quercetin dioxygenase-like cupin family protein
MSVKISKLSETDAISLPAESWSKMVLTKDSVGVNKISMGVSCFKPGLKTDLMVHEEEELAYVLQGKGKIGLTDGGSIKYEAGDGIFIPAGVAHSVINDGDEDVVMVAGFSWPEYPPTHKESE